MNLYVEFVTEYPIFSAMIQFAVLGTLGDIFSKWMQKGAVYSPYKFNILLLKMLEWALLAVTIKFAFVGYQGFVESLVSHHLLPELNLFSNAFLLSEVINNMCI